MYVSFCAHFFLFCGFDESFQGHVRSAMVKGNAPSSIHAPPAEKSYHSPRIIFAGPTEWRAPVSSEPRTTARMRVMARPAMRAEFARWIHGEGLPWVKRFPRAK
jgi:hypothetical protein